MRSGATAMNPSVARAPARLRTQSDSRWRSGGEARRDGRPEGASGATGTIITIPRDRSGCSGCTTQVRAGALPRERRIEVRSRRPSARRRQMRGGGRSLGTDNRTYRRRQGTHLKRRQCQESNGDSSSHFRPPCPMRRVGDGASFPAEGSSRLRCRPEDIRASAARVNDPGDSKIRAGRGSTPRGRLPNDLRVRTLGCGRTRSSHRNVVRPARWEATPFGGVSAPMVSPKAVAATYQNRLERQNGRLRDRGRRVAEPVQTIEDTVDVRLLRSAR